MSYNNDNNVSCEELRWIRLLLFSATARTSPFLSEYKYEPRISFQPSRVKVLFVTNAACVVPDPFNWLGAAGPVYGDPNPHLYWYDWTFSVVCYFTYRLYELGFSQVFIHCFIAWLLSMVFPSATLIRIRTLLSCSRITVWYFMRALPHKCPVCRGPFLRLPS